MILLKSDKILQYLHKLTDLSRHDNSQIKDSNLKKQKSQLKGKRDNKKKSKKALKKVELANEKQS
jgi:hypothetical protein